MKRVLWTIVVFALLGVAVSFYASLHNRGVTEGSICNINETFSCDAVNQSEYADFLGMPVAVLGIIGYLFLLAGAILKLRVPKDKGLTLFIGAAATAGFAFSLYLTSIEAFILHAYCPICLISQAIMLVIFLAMLRILWLERKHS